MATRLSAPHPALAVRDLPGRGRGLVVERPIARGTLLLSEAPFAAVVDDGHHESHCAACFGELPDTKLRCSGCEFLHYCGRSCQRTDWTAGHKAECPALAKAPRRPTTSVRLLARVLERRIKDKELYSDGIARMESHRADFDLEALEQFPQMAFLVQSLLSPQAANGLEADEMISLFCRFTCNAMSVTAPGSDLVNVGVAILPHAALINHSCAPNAVLNFVRDTQNNLRAEVRSIEGLAREGEVSISYLPVETLPRVKRKTALQKQYFFQCTCSLCTLPVDPLEALFCAQCTNEFAHEGSDSPVTCPSCAFIVVSDVGKLNEILDEAASLSATTAGLSVERVRRSLLHLESLKALGPQHHALLNLRTLLYETLIASGSYADAYLASLELSRMIRPPLVSTFHPARTLRLLLTAKLAGHFFELHPRKQSSLDEVRELTERAMEGVRIAFGGDGEFYRRCVHDLGLAN